ncbi:hypothetical protein ASC65_12475 [Brevundimonas sp. Root1279]|nr:hypothetical protein ASC65_12475 [Brevundimonas sp. Root1279]
MSSLDPVAEQLRLNALHDLAILDTPPEPRFDRVTRLAAGLFNVPTALVTLIDGDRQWFKSTHGMDLTETRREDAICSHAIQLPPASVMVVPDASRDPRFADNPHVVGAGGVRFYAGAVLTTAAGHNLGTLCLIDTSPRYDFNEGDQARLRELADLVAEQLELSGERRAAEEEHRLLALAETVSHVGHWRWRLDTGAVIWSDEVYRIYGLDPATPLKRESWLGVAADEDRAEREAFIERVFKDGSSEEFETTIQRPDGTRRRVLVSGLRQVDKHGRAAAIFGVVQDVTERHQALEHLRRSEARYRLVANHMGDVVTRLKLDGRSSYISPAVTGLLGFTPEEMAGRPAQAFLHPDDQGELLNTFARLAGGERRAILQHRAMHKDGHEVWVETTFQTVLDPDGRPVEVIAVIRDVSERRRLEQDLREARDRAELASEAKSHFLANMSHELRTPLTSVIGFSTLLQAREGLGPVERRCADRINIAGKALLSVINDILDFSRLEAGGMALDIQPFEPRKLFGEAIEIILGQIEDKELWLSQDISPDLPEVLLGDGPRVRQVLLNLMGNAIKFTDQGGVTLGVTAKPRSGGEPGVLLRVTVTDTGVGIAPELAERLFERFIQADQTTTRRHGGSGLGLAISRQLIEMMDGRIGVSSVPGQGSTFWFEVPLPPG